MKHLSHLEWKIVDAHSSGKKKIWNLLLDNVFRFLREEIAQIHEKWAEEVKQAFGCQRNGYYERGLICELGDLGLIRVPRFRRSVNVENPIFPKSSRYAHGVMAKMHIPLDYGRRLPN